MPNYTPRTSHNRAGDRSIAIIDDEKEHVGRHVVAETMLVDALKLMMIEKVLTGCRSGSKPSGPSRRHH